MNTPKHTLGPWRVNRKVKTSVEQAAAGQGINIICHCDDLDGGRPRAEDEANARLIAAAPELLAACRHAAMSEHHPACKSREHCTCHVGKARAALAAAGEEV